jgi:predicted Zn-dependent peptidase
MIDYTGLPDDFLTTYRSKIGEVKAEDIRKQAAQYLSPAKAIILIIGSEQAHQEISKKFENVTRINATY